MSDETALDVNAMSSLSSSPPSSSSSPMAIAIIGCGAGGMFFCHALETYRRELQENGDEAALFRLPDVTVLERSSGPGGVWRTERTFAAAKVTVSPEANGEKEQQQGEEEEEKKSPVGDYDEEGEVDTVPEETTNMYEALWTNGPCQSIEMFDYTFDEHFGGPIPVYLPRQALLGYMTARVSRNCPDFFDKYCQFRTNVVSVRYERGRKKFEIVTQNLTTRRYSTTEYDKCIWAAGENGKPKMPASVVSLFRHGGFQGRIIHSSDTADFEADVKGKRVLLIGGSYSAEDLALMAIKVGAEQVYVSSRQKENVVSWMGAWPKDKVHILYGQIPINVKEDGRLVQFSKTEWSFPGAYAPVTTGEIETEVRDIDTVIFCTGYSANLDMLDPELRAPFDKPMDKMLQVPSDWKMDPNDWTEVLGEVKPAAMGVHWNASHVRYPDLYRGFLISNPSMIFLENEHFANPLFGIEGNAWLLMRFLTGRRPLPSQDEMKRQNEEDALRQMQIPYVRYYMDRSYYEAYNKRYSSITSDMWYKSQKEYYRTYYRIMARTLEEANYPVITYGTYSDLNDTATTVFRYGDMGYYHRVNLDPNNQEEKDWRTFRDYNDADKFCSIITGTPAVPLKKRWMDMNASDESILIR